MSKSHKKVLFGQPKKPIDKSKWVGESDVKRLTVIVPQDLHLKFKSYAAKNGKSISEVVIKLVKDYLSHKDTQRD